MRHYTVVALARMCMQSKIKAVADVISNVSYHTELGGHVKEVCCSTATAHLLILRAGLTNSR